MKVQASYQKKPTEKPQEQPVATTLGDSLVNLVMSLSAMPPPIAAPPEPLKSTAIEQPQPALDIDLE